MMTSRPATKMALLALAALLAACAPKPGGGLEHGETYFLDAALGFAIEYPAPWSRVKTAATEPSPAVRWFPKPEKGREPAVRASVTSLLPSEVTGGYESMLEDFVAAHPGFVLTARETVQLADSTPALQVSGSTRVRTFLALFVTSSRRAFTLEFSAPAEKFAQYLPLFQEMADSFMVLE